MSSRLNKYFLGFLRLFLFFFFNRVLSSTDILTTDEESSGEEGSDLEDLGKDLESMLSNKKMSNEVIYVGEKYVTELALSSLKSDDSISS